MRIGSWAGAALVAVVGMAGAARAASVGVEAGGGYADYGWGLGADTSGGAAWNAMVSLEATRYLGVELGYAGSRVTVDKGGADTSLNQHGLATDLKLGVPLGLVRPYAFAGVGVARLDFDAILPKNDDTVLDVPVGAGVELKLARGFSLDGRVAVDRMYQTDFNKAPGAQVGTTETGASEKRLTATIGLAAKL